MAALYLLHKSHMADEGFGNIVNVIRTISAMVSK